MCGVSCRRREIAGDYAAISFPRSCLGSDSSAFWLKQSRILRSLVNLLGVSLKSGSHAVPLPWLPGGTDACRRGRQQADGQEPNLHAPSASLRLGARIPSAVADIRLLCRQAPSSRFTIVYVRSSRRFHRHQVAVPRDAVVAANDYVLVHQRSRYTTIKHQRIQNFAGIL